ncbi:MAG: hypothetical protein CMJ94_14910 [Planctomycetes bacterium]|nr:hypothetical protein [Planctomycetota bacterium]
MTRIHDSYLLRALVSGAALVGVLLLADGQPGWLDALLVAAIVGVLTFELRELAQRLSAAEGERDELSLPRLVLIWAAALVLTVWLEPAQQDTWRQPLGIVFLVLAILATLRLFLRELAAMRALGEDGR